MARRRCCVRVASVLKRTESYWLLCKASAESQFRIKLCKMRSATLTSASIFYRSRAFPCAHFNTVGALVATGFCATLSAHHCPVRHVRTPLGGFEEDLPPSFGRQNAKGEVSTVNLRKKRRLLQLRSKKRKLATPSASELSPEKITEELKKLVKMSAVYSNKKPGDGEVSFCTGVDDSSNVVNEDTQYHNSRPYQQSLSVAKAHAEREAERMVPLASLGDSSCATHQSIAHLLIGDELSISEAGEIEKVDAAASESHTAKAVLPLSSKNSSLFPLHLSGDGNAGGSEGNDDSQEMEKLLEKRFSVSPGSTVFGSDLDRLEREMLREFQQQGLDLPAPDKAFSQFGGGRNGIRMRWEPSSSFDHIPDMPQKAEKRIGAPVGSSANRNLAAYHMYAETYRIQQKASGERGKGLNMAKPDPAGSTTAEVLATSRGSAVDQVDESACCNPHFPVIDEPIDISGSSNIFDKRDDAESLRKRVVKISARSDFKPYVSTSGQYGSEDSVQHDTYTQRAADARLVYIRDSDYWDAYDKRQSLEERSQIRHEAFMREKLLEGAMDTSESEYSVNRLRKETFLYFQAHPVNEMIQEHFVRIRQVLPKGGGEALFFNAQHNVGAAYRIVTPSTPSGFEKLEMDVDIPVGEARRMAQELGLDLIRIGSINSQKTDRRVVALCLVADHREHLREMVKFKIQKLGVQPPPMKQCIEVPFKGGTHPHAIRFKSVGIAKQLLQRHAIRVNVTKFGTPREGFAVLQSILDEVKHQCLRLSAFHKAGEIQANYNEIYCYLYPSTARSPKTTVEHPAPEQVLQARDHRILENEKEIFFDDLHDLPTQKKRLRYLTKLRKGTAWADKDNGMSLQRQRAIKVMLGYLPKGNSDIYAARGDVNIPAPFRTSHPTSTQRWSYPTESNLDQASRGAAALGKRAGMTISEMHDKDETPQNPTQLDRFYYRVQGPALEVGEFKESLGLKNNRLKSPPFGQGFATLGMEKSGALSAPESFTVK